MLDITPMGGLGGKTSAQTNNSGDVRLKWAASYKMSILIAALPRNLYYGQCGKSMLYKKL